MVNMDKKEILSGGLLGLEKTVAIRLISRLLNEDASLSLAVRNGYYSKLLSSSDLSTAKKVIDIILSVNKAEGLYFRDSSSLYLKLGKSDKALEQIKKAVILLPNDTKTLEHALQVSLVAKDLTYAVCISRQLKPSWPESIRVTTMAMNAFYRSALNSEACQAAEVLISLEPNNLNNVSAAASILTSCNRASLAKKSLLHAGANNCNLARPLYELTRALFEIDSKDPNVISIAEKCKLVTEDTSRIDFILAKSYAEQGHIKVGIDILTGSKKPTINMLHELAKLYIRSGDYTLGVKIYKTLVEKQTENAAIHKEYVSALILSGNNEYAKEVYNKELKIRSEKLPNSFNIGIDKIYQSRDFSRIPQYRKDWVYECLLQSNIDIVSKHEWELELDRVNAIDHYILDWLECNPSDIEETYAFFENFQTELCSINKCLEKGKGAFIATAHVGLLFAGPVALELAGIKGAWLASVPDLSDDRHNGSLISTTTLDETKVVRNILKSLSHNMVVAIACDGDKGTDKSTCTLFGQKVDISNFIPKLSYKRKIASFFPLISWENRKIQIELIELPFPNTEESMDKFVERWLVSFTNNLRNAFYRHPTSLRGTGGFWTKLKF